MPYVYIYMYLTKWLCFVLLYRYGGQDGTGQRCSTGAKARHGLNEWGGGQSAGPGDKLHHLSALHCTQKGVCVCVCMRAYNYVYVNVWVLSVSACTHACMCMCVHMLVCMCVCMCACVCLRENERVCVWVHTRVFLY